MGASTGNLAARVRAVFLAGLPCPGFPGLDAVPGRLGPCRRHSDRRRHRLLWPGREPAVIAFQVLAVWALWLALAGLAWCGAAAVCHATGIATGPQSILTGACLVVTIIAAL